MGGFVDEDEEQQFRLSVRAHPWRATLQPLRPVEEGSVPPEQFDSPLDLLARLEQQGGPTGGLR